MQNPMQMSWFHLAAKTALQGHLRFASSRLCVSPASPANLSPFAEATGRPAPIGG